jgi:NAD(P)-dependent dehydrogenase (short-subunit alcohol dehydrogenase family)
VRLLSEASIRSFHSVALPITYGKSVTGGRIHHRRWLRYVWAHCVDAPANDPKGIGQYTAYAFASYGIRRLAICDIRPEALEQTALELKNRHPGIEVLSIRMDASKEHDVDSAVAQTVDKFGRLDIGVNNAGIGGEAPTDQLKFMDWRRVMNVNLDGVFLCQRAQIRQMLKQGLLDPAPRGTRGVIVNVVRGS